MIMQLAHEHLVVDDALCSCLLSKARGNKRWPRGRIGPAGEETSLLAWATAT